MSGFVPPKFTGNSSSSIYCFNKGSHISFFAKIKNSMLFVGQGQTFQIWEPTAFEKFKTSARKKANLHRASLKWEKHLNNNEGK